MTKKLKRAFLLLALFFSLQAWVAAQSTANATNPVVEISNNGTSAVYEIYTPQLLTPMLAAGFDNPAIEVKLNGINGVTGAVIIEPNIVRATMLLTTAQNILRNHFLIQ